MACDLSTSCRLAYWILDNHRKDWNNHLQNRRVVLFTLSSLFNIAWILLWHYEFFTWTVVVMAALLATLTRTFILRIRKMKIVFSKEFRLLFILDGYLSHLSQTLVMF